MCRLV
ncbi:hypothetical protein F383_18746 [Gossypium arboreum]